METTSRKLTHRTHTGSDSSSYLTSNVETEEHSTTSDLPHVLTKIDPGGFIENHVRIASESERVARTPVRSEDLLKLKKMKLASKETAKVAEVMPTIKSIKIADGFGTKIKRENQYIALLVFRIIVINLFVRAFLSTVPG